MKIQQFTNLEAISHSAADLIVHLSEKHIALDGRFSIALSGGETPRRLYQLLASVSFRNKINWPCTHIFLVDERFVARNHADSNSRMIHENLIQGISIPKDNVHLIRTDVNSASDAASFHEDEIRGFFNSTVQKFPDFDLILLGLGDDGHTASLFPDNKMITVENSLVVSTESPHHHHARITMTLPVLKNAKNIVFLVSGRKKASILKRVIIERDTSLPASLVQPAHDNLFYLIDKDAGIYLNK